MGGEAADERGSREDIAQGAPAARRAAEVVRGHAAARATDAAAGRGWRGHAKARADASSNGPAEKFAGTAGPSAHAAGDEEPPLRAAKHEVRRRRAKARRSAGATPGCYAGF